MIAAYVETDGGALTPDAADVLAVARELAAHHGVPVAAVATPGSGEAGDLPDALAKLGVPRLWLLAADPSPTCIGDALAQWIGAVGPEAVLAADTDHGGEVLARAAARRGLPLATRCTEVRPGTPWSVTRERAGGILLEDAEIDAPVTLCTLAPGAAPVVGEPHPGDVVVEVFTPEPDTVGPVARLVSREQRAAGIGLATAPVVVAGGRGVGSAEGYAVLEELAGLLGGAVGCSRVATNAGWRPHADQVGLTGTRIAPDLYVACGISGATQHWVGCMGARTILAINTDPDAPMVTRSTYAVIGDVHEVLPAVVAELRKRR